MPRCAESAYSLALIAELHRTRNIDYFFVPSLRHENRVGYDFYGRIDGDHYFFQFKVPTTPRNPYPACHPYKFQLKLQQHTRLQRIQNLDVYYVAPVFSQVQELAAHFSAGTVEANSLALPMSGFPQLTYAHHHVTYDAHDARVHSSDPQALKHVPLNAVLQRPGLHVADMPAAEFITRLIGDLLPEETEKKEWQRLLRRESEQEIGFALMTALDSLQLTMLTIVRNRERARRADG